MAVLIIVNLLIYIIIAILINLQVPYMPLLNVFIPFNTILRFLLYTRMQKKRKVLKKIL